MSKQIFITWTEFADDLISFNDEVKDALISQLGDVEMLLLHLCFQHDVQLVEVCLNKRKTLGYNEDFIIVPLMLNRFSSHVDYWNELNRVFIPVIEKYRGNTFHFDYSIHIKELHDTMLLFLYSGRLIHPFNFWFWAKNPSGTKRLRTFQLPVDSLNLRLQKQSGFSSEAFYNPQTAKNSQLKNTLELLIAVARLPDIPVLILGEKGTGKTRLIESLFAAIKQKKVKTVVCGSLQPELAMSQLFGHVKGAFTGADKESVGLIGEASDGILFFDEVQDLPVSVQRVLVRFLQDSHHLYRQLGSSGKEVSSNAEVIFASHKTKEELAECLDQDLLDRISLVTLYLPSLREMREEIPDIWIKVWAEHNKIEKLFIEPGHPVLSSWFSVQVFEGNIRDLISLCLWIQIFFIQYNDPDVAVTEAVKQLATVDTQKTVKEDFNFPKNLDNGSHEWLPLKGQLSKYRHQIVVEAVKHAGSFAGAARLLSVDEKTVRNTINPGKNPSDFI